MMLSSFAFAESKVCYVNESCSFISNIFESSTSYYDVKNATTSLKATNGTYLIQNQSMTKISTGTFTYNYNFNSSETFVRETIYDNLYIGTEEIIVREDTSSLLLEDSKLIANILTIITIFTIGILLVIIGRYCKNIYLTAMSSLWFVMASLTPYTMDYSGFGLPPYSFTFLYIGIAGLLAVDAWFTYDRNKFQRNN